MNNQPAKQKNSYEIELTPIDRMLMLSAIILQTLLFVVFNLKMVHYLLQPIPALFSSPSLLASFYFTQNYAYNGLLYSLFFVQHVVMAMISFKSAVTNYYSKFPLYQRYVYNVFSCWV